MANEIRMPKMGLTMTTATVGKWLKNEGDPVSAGEAVVEVMTDKITNVVEASEDGVLLKIIAPEGSEWEASALLAYTGAAGEAVPAGGESSAPAKPEPQAQAQAAPAAEGPAAPAPAVPAGGRVFITPIARKIAREKGLDISQLKGTGPGGRIVRKDAEAAMTAESTAQSPQTALATQEADVLERVPYTGMRKAVGTHMSESASSVPRVTHHTTVPMDTLLALRSRLNEGREKEDRFTVTDLLVKITAVALSRYPAMNAHFTGTEVVRMRPVHMGVAVAVEEGLVVPVIRNAEAKSLSAISREIKDMVVRAQSRSLGQEELSGGTFTISNVGGYRSVDLFTPVINLPQVGILGIGRTIDAPWVEDGMLVVKPLMGLSLTFDHRAIDGAPAAEFLAVLNGLIADPLSAIV